MKESESKITIRVQNKGKNAIALFFSEHDVDRRYLLVTVIVLTGT